MGTTTAARPPPATVPAARPTGGMGSGLGGTLAQGAALGAGAAVGSTMVHGAMNMMSGSGSSNQEQAQQQNRTDPYAAQNMQQQQPAQANPCAYQLQDFLNCAQSQ